MKRLTIILLSCILLTTVLCASKAPNPTVAKTNALIEASTKASQDMIDQLRLKLTTNK